ncbi:LexA family protein [Sutcliffiella cohnii]
MTENLKAIMAENLKKQLDKKGITQTMMAKDLNIPEMTVSNWVKGKTYPRPDKIQMMADYFGIKRSQLTEKYPTNLEPVSPLTIPIPILGKIACGNPIVAEENFTGYFHESPEYLPSGKLLCLEATGDSMYPTIPNGAKVIIREQPDVESGEIAAVLLNGDTEATLKRVKKQGNTILLVPDNPAYDPIIVDEYNPVKIIGKAVKFSFNL